MMATATAPMLTMLGVMGCASLCALFASCRPVASMVCALAMILGMIDVAYTHLLPIELIVAAIVASGLWVGLSGTMTADPRDMAMRGHRILCALAMAALMYRHAQLMAAKGFCTGRPHHDQMDLTAYMLAGTGALLLSGALLTFAMLPGRNGRPGSLPKSIAAFEPALMGLGLVLMAT